MVSHKQADIARSFTGSNLSTAAINREIRKTPKAVKIPVCLDVDSVVNEYDLPYEKAYPIVKGSIAVIAKRVKVDPASLFCIYMEWKSKK